MRLTIPVLSTCAACLVLMSLAASGLRAEEPAKTEKITDKITRLVYSDGREEWDVTGRGKVTFMPTKPSAEVVKPSAADFRRGFVAFVSRNREGVLPQYRPAKDEIASGVSMSAAPGEFELATLAILPLRDLGKVTFSVGELRGPGRSAIKPESIDTYITEPTVEQVGLYPPESNVVRWVAKWLRPANAVTASRDCCIQAYFDIHMPEDAKPGVYSGAIKVSSDAGKSSFPVKLEVLDLKLEQPMPWGLYLYSWPKIGDNLDDQKRTLAEMRRIGMSQAVLSPIWMQFGFGVSKDGEPDFSVWDQCVDLYTQAGFRNPPILAMEGLMYGITEAVGKSGEVKWANEGGMSVPGVKADDIPADVREFAKKVVRRVYDHGLEKKWPNFYAYFVDECSPGPRTEKALFMGKVAREAAPELSTAGTLYTHGWWQPLSGLLDLNIAHYVHPCNNEDANRRWHEFAKEMRTSRLYGIEFIGPFDSQWEGRRLTFTLEKGTMDGMMCWVQWPGWNQHESFSPYQFLENSWKGGPFWLRQDDGQMWRSLPWMGIREGIDDSRYVRTLRVAIDKAIAAGRPAIAAQAKKSLEMLMADVPWVPGSRSGENGWSSDSADKCRRDLAEAAMICLKEIGK